MLSVAATVERTLDERARRQPIDVGATVSRLQQRIDAVRSAAERSRTGRQRDTAAHLAYAAASLTRLTAPDSDAWAEAAARCAELGDRWMTAAASLAKPNPQLLAAQRVGRQHRSDKRTRSPPSSGPCRF